MTLNLPERPAKPRSHGLTAITDTGLSCAELEAILADYAEFIDVAKFGVGSAYVTPRLDDKIRLYRDAGVHCYFGGTLFEKFYAQQKLEDYLTYLDQHGINWIEVSEGVVPIPLEERLALVERLKQQHTVLAEVGNKDTDAIMSPSVWLNELGSLLDAGCTYVITEGRDSGTAGIYRPSGEIRTGLASDIASSLPVEKIIFEAPTPKSQMFFINLVGTNVNLGNVAPRNLLLLEAQRVGLRYETFGLPNDA